MKHLAITAAALFLFAAPGAFAQNDSDNGGTNTGGNGNTDTNTNTGGASATNDNQGGDGGQSCPAPAAGQTFDNFSEACRNEINIWVDKQTAASATFEGEIAVGTVLPDTIEVIEVPAYRDYGYVMLNDRRVLVDRGTRTVVRVF